MFSVYTENTNYFYFNDFSHIVFCTAGDQNTVCVVVTDEKLPKHELTFNVYYNTGIIVAIE